MGFTVQDMLDMKLFQKANLLWGKGGIGQEIRGVTIIESPDIVRFISGGEVLLTGLNAFQNCSPEEFRSYIAELAKKKVSALVIKRGRTVDFMEEKMAVILPRGARAANTGIFSQQYSLRISNAS